MDMLKVGEVAKEAIARAQRGDGLILVECETHQYIEVILSPIWTSSASLQKSKHAACNPIPPFKKYLLEERLASEAELKAIEKKNEEIVEDAVEFADTSLLPPHIQILENVGGSLKLWNLMHVLNTYKSQSEVSPALSVGGSHFTEVGESANVPESSIILKEPIDHQPMENGSSHQSCWSLNRSLRWL
ncbi:hypothetical protein SELMODRAFT_429697 [Selaginella moellendorffii]|uniref:Dehydrogenase E1 component domain-containing protein n=1 Tax=Selaginella moellendorffii TaxID=88036 RepID=D8T704_SELML|nr:hypothetical protein SELMODRAFT_429697 [Selaginella moellendorffii]